MFPSNTLILLFYFVSILGINVAQQSNFGLSIDFNRISRALAVNTSTADQALSIQKQRKKIYKQNYIPYTDAENIVRKVSQTWGEFYVSPHKVPRSKPYIRSSVAKSLQQCVAPNAAPACAEVIIKSSP